jgi:hypothetical protein
MLGVGHVIMTTPKNPQGYYLKAFKLTMFLHTNFLKFSIFPNFSTLHSAYQFCDLIPFHIHK